MGQDSLRDSRDLQRSRFEKATAVARLAVVGNHDLVQIAKTEHVCG